MYLCSGDDDADAQFHQLADCFGDLLFFCINDTSDETAAHMPELQRIRLTLTQLLPTPSRFEIAAPPHWVAENDATMGCESS